jgi:hypothetical protein
MSGAVHAATAFTNSLQTTEINQTGFLDKFDSSLGTLNGVSLTWGGQAVTTITLTNNASQDQRLKATSSVDLAFSSNDSAINAILSAITLSMEVNSGGFISLPTGGSQTFGPISDSDVASFSAGSGAAILAAFTGPGTFSVTCESLSGINLQGGGGNVSSSQETQAACGASVEYSFTTNKVPEPGTLALLGAMAVGAGVLSRRTRKA